MIHNDIICEAQRLLRRGTSYRAVARELGISRGTVGKVALGRRVPVEAGACAEDENPPYHSNTPPVRCPTCGGVVYMPCVACRVKTAVKTRAILPASPDLSGCSSSLTLSLKDDHQARYELVKAMTNGHSALPTGN